ncbi:lytic transglycosylase domain-containing protein [Sphingobium sufflavum]|uniref:lytic transglycosylase domain-containing protein n=1 Tax=Sphingobium sufflavum TaxID=1129547 RepID=UPI001F331D17|nr:lytic transglycosylase domain-containing protein [Sphingobium sufflavum]MCE7798546.1 lytic transglycosylase domain-containing protein [Sphingobium sufflavum]
MTKSGGMTKSVRNFRSTAIGLTLTFAASVAPSAAQAADDAQGPTVLMPAFAPDAFVTAPAAPVSAPAFRPAPLPAPAPVSVPAVSAAPVQTLAGPALYRSIFDRLDASAWSDAKGAILSLPEQDAMRPYLLAKLYLAKDSPRTELFDILDLLTKAPHLPQSEQLARLATRRGAQILPDRPQIRQLMYTGGSPQRGILKAIKGDPVSDMLSPQVAAAIKADTPALAESLIASQGAGLSIACLTEMRQRIAWSYFITGDVTNARRLALQATAEGSGPYLAPAYWVAGLASWRDKDWDGAAAAFANVSARTDDSDLRSAGYYWAARANMAGKRPQKVTALLQAAAREDETFYGLLSSETLGLPTPTGLLRDPLSAREKQKIAALPGAVIATSLASIRRLGDADETLRYQASISGPENYEALVHLASELSLPRTQLWLAQRSPTGVKARAYTRYPKPDWTPTGGWRVDKALVFAHALQESRFQADAVSLAGARGLMQVLPGTANDLAAARGEALSPGDLYTPAVNMEYGQRYLEKLSNMGATDGLLAKVIAAYNAGPLPVERWKYQIRDEGDPLLFIESVPYYETRAYVNVVLRNYWMYQMENGGKSGALNAMAQGLWSRFPGRGTELAVRMTAAGRAAGAD